MAELYQVVGAILRDLSQARVTSDIYSREVSLFYERDSLLRYFPVPRTEISSVEIELKFAIHDVANKSKRASAADVLLSSIVEKYSELIARSFTSRFVSAIEIDRTLNPRHPEWQSFKAQYQNKEALQTIRQMLASTILGNAEAWIAYDDAGNVVFQVEQAHAIIRDKLLATDFWRALSQLIHSVPVASALASAVDRPAPELTEDELTGRARWVQGKVRDILDHRLLVHLRTMGDQLRAVEDAKEDVQIDVLITAEQLQHVAPSAVSSIKLHTVIRNSVWTQMDSDDDAPDRSPVRRLTPE